MMERLISVFSPTTPYVAELSVILPAIVEACDFCEAVANSKGTETTNKQDESPVTIADYGSQMIIVEAIRKRFVEDLIIAEEDECLLDERKRARILEFVKRPIPFASLAGNCTTSPSRRFWTIDPIDGTKGYIRGAQYSICVALVVDERVVMSAIGCPRLALSDASMSREGTLIFAIKGQGAFQAGILDGPAQALPLLSEPRHLSNAILAEGYEPSHADHGFSSSLRASVGMTQNGTIRLDSQCKYGLVARAQANIYLRRPRNLAYREKIWDHAPGSLLVEEAGGRVTGFDGNPIKFEPKPVIHTGGGILATNGLVGTAHGTILDRIRALL